jgi:hypothetical protein
MKKLNWIGITITVVVSTLFSLPLAIAQSTDALVVDQTGRVGIGTTTPSGLVHIYGQETSNQGPRLIIEHSDTAVGNTDLIGTIEFRGLDTEHLNSVGAKINARGTAEWSSSANDAPTALDFYTQSDGNTDDLANPRMTIDSTGKVGIGTTSPEEKLHVSGGGIMLDNNKAIYTKDSSGTKRTLVYKDSNDDTNVVSQNLRKLFLGYPGNQVTITHQNNLGIGTTQFGTGATKVLGLGNGTAPTSSPSDMVQLYAVDYVDGDGTATSELFVRDEDGTAVDLSPHIFALFKPDPNERFPWSYYAENNYIGKRINVDMAGAIRAIERLTGKQFIFYSDVPKVDPIIEKRQAWKETWIAQNITEVEISKDEALQSVTVTVEDQSQVVTERISYALNGRDVIEVRTPVYANKTRQEWRLKEGVRFDTETGRFFQKKVPTDQEAETAAQSQFEVSLPQWVKDRM